MNKIIKEIFWEDLKDNTKFVMQNLKEILKRTWSDFLNDFKND